MREIYDNELDRARYSARRWLRDAKTDDERKAAQDSLTADARNLVRRLWGMASPSPIFRRAASTGTSTNYDIVTFEGRKGADRGRKKRGILVSQKRMTTGGRNARYDLAYYPHYSDVEKFCAGIRGLREGGPSGMFPGAVGVGIYAKDGAGYAIRELQGCFKIRDPGSDSPNSSASSVDAKLAKKYSDWKYHVLNRIFDQAQKEGAANVSIDVKLNCEGWGKDNERTFRQVAEARGCDIENREGHLRALLPKRTASHGAIARIQTKSFCK